MRLPRTAGVLLHPTSLPGPNGIGDLGPEAHRFLEILSACRGVALADAPARPYRVRQFTVPMLLVVRRQSAAHSCPRAAPGAARAHGRFPAASSRQARVAPCSRPARSSSTTPTTPSWREGEPGGSRTTPSSWRSRTRTAAWPGPTGSRVRRSGIRPRSTDWRARLAARDRALPAGTGPLLRASSVRSRPPRARPASSSWATCRSTWRTIRPTSGPIPGFFKLDTHGRLLVQAGVPPDYFSATGQLWGNPDLSTGDAMRADGYAWWIRRMRSAFALFDLVRVDHFRGFEAYWEVPAGEEPTAVNGRWAKGPGRALLRRDHQGARPAADRRGEPRRHHPGGRSVAPRRFGYPGMSILQFAFGTDDQANSFLPHTYDHDLVVYTGTHDNDTTMGWWNSTGEGDSTRSAGRRERRRRSTRLRVSRGRRRSK